MVYKLYKLSNILYKNKIPFIPKLITYMIRILFSAWIPYQANIGKSTLGKGGLGIVIHHKSQIGDYCIISHNVTIGGSSDKEKGKLPVIGNYVRIGAGASILGDVKVGNNVIIGSNAVVVNDIPSNSIAVGVPAKVIKTNINIDEYISFTKIFN